jgi:hypothetical protein
LIYSLGVLVAEGRSLDRSEDGAFILLSDDMSGGELRPGSVVEAWFEQADRVPGRRQLVTEVVRRSGNGVALAFRDR